jgi:hypothetical protein
LLSFLAVLELQAHLAQSEAQAQLVRLVQALLAQSEAQGLLD